MLDSIQKLTRLLYKYTIAIKHSFVLLFRSCIFLPFRTWLRFWIPGAYTDGEITINSLRFAIRNRRLSERIADLYMIMTCAQDKQYNPLSFEIKPHDTIIDIGGHIGSFSLLAAKTARTGHIYTYEPDPRNFALLQKNIASNGISNITPIPFAVTASGGTRTFYSHSVNSAESGMYQKGIGAECIFVHTVPLAEIFRTHQISECDFLKLDCEGAEYEILFAVPPELLKRIKKIVLECHNPAYFNISDPRYTQETMNQFLRKNGYTVTEIKENAMHSLIFAQRL